MATLSKQDMIKALRRVGELALERGTKVELLVVGGAFMVLAFNARAATKDIDAVFLNPPDTRDLRAIADRVALEFDWQTDWLNDAAKGYLVGHSEGALLFEGPGIEVRGPAVEQILAMKLTAWRDDVDIEDARLLMKELAKSSNRLEVWESIGQFLLPGSQLKAQYAFDDLWEAIGG